MNEILAWIGYIVLFVNLILFFLKIQSKRGLAYLLFTIYMSAMFIIQIVAYILRYYKIHNLFLSHFYFILQFVILSAFYVMLLKSRFQKNIVKVGLAAGSIALAVQYAMNPGIFFKFNLFEIFITSFPLIVYSTFHFYNLLNEKKEFYYLNTGLLVYLFGSTVLFLAGNLVASLSEDINTITWTLNAFLYIIYQIFIFIEWWKSFSGKIVKSE